MKPRFDKYAILFETNDKQLRVYWSNWRSNNYVNIRTWYKDKTGKWAPTKRGAAIPECCYKHLMEALSLVSDDSGESGL